MRCPLCHDPSDADWPLRMAVGSIEEGGCQMCWEKQRSEAWWEAVCGPTESPKSTPAMAGVQETV
jgi:hypothetical protein